MLKSPDQIARTTIFNGEVADRAKYKAWLASKDVSTEDTDETVIAWKLAKIIDSRPGYVIRAMRGQAMQAKPGLVGRVERIIEANPSIEFQTDEAGVRRTVFVRALSGSPVPAEGQSGRQ